MTKYHDLKIKQEFFEPIASGIKTFEIRKNDRDFKVNDEITLHEITDDGLFTDRSLNFKITYICDYEQKPGYVVFSIEPIK